ncbi:MAG TPA: ATP-binding protein, partial [Alphaproteobacteria bacterium]|nr:ATP-binding protein [Alphaproteobacteria bacterium]
ASAFIAGRYGVLPGLITAVGSYVTMHFLYLEPTLHSLVRNPADAMDFALFISVAFVLGLLVSRQRAQVDMREEQIQRMQALFRMYRASLRTHTYQKTLEALHDELTAALKTEVIFFLPAPFNPDRIEAAMPVNPTLSEEDQGALELAWQEAKVTGFASHYYGRSHYRFKPLVTPGAVIGVIAFRMDKRSMVDEAYSRLRTAIADSVALILERLTLGQAMEEGRVREEREKLRSMLLSSVSHDLKTPLASVIGSLSVYRSIGAQLPEAQRSMLLQTALEEAQRLDSFITNILDMTRLESGQIQFKQEWVKASDLVRSVEKRLRDRLHAHPLTVVGRQAADQQEVCTDVMMTEQVLQNVLDNAAKYTPAGTGIEVNWGVQDGQFQFQVRDRGPGIPDGQLEKIFDKYARIKRTDSQSAGTGLGLAIARSVMQAQGGSITAANHPEGGAVFTIVLPAWRKLQPAPGDELVRVA